MAKIFFLIFFLLILILNFAQAAGISIGGTRFVYEENKREIDIPIFNTDKEKPFLIQSWVTPFDGEGKTPFIATPPLFRIEPNTNSAARIAYIGKPVGTNQEIMYLLNVKAIPPKDKNIENELQIIINSQFKFFLRSKDIEPFNFEKVILLKKIDGIMIDNQTPYHLSIKDILINDKSAKGINIIYPFKNEYIFRGNTRHDTKIVVQFINDYGAIIEKKIK